VAFGMYSIARWWGRRVAVASAVLAIVIMLPPAQLTAFGVDGSVALALVGLGVGLPRTGHARGAPRGRARGWSAGSVSGPRSSTASTSSSRAPWPWTCSCGGAPRRRAIALGRQRDRNARRSRARAVRARRVRHRVSAAWCSSRCSICAPAAGLPIPPASGTLRRLSRRSSAVSAASRGGRSRMVGRAQAAVLLVLHQPCVDRLRDRRGDLGGSTRPHVDPRPCGPGRWAALPRRRFAVTPAGRLDAHRLGQLHLHLAPARRDDGGAHGVGADPLRAA
jgi:hypothetical protein